MTSSSPPSSKRALLPITMSLTVDSSWPSFSSLLFLFGVSFVRSLLCRYLPLWNHCILVCNTRMQIGAHIYTKRFMLFVVDDDDDDDVRTESIENNKKKKRLFNVNGRFVHNCRFWWCWWWIMLHWQFMTLKYHVERQYNPISLIFNCWQLIDSHIDWDVQLCVTLSCKANIFFICLVAVDHAIRNICSHMTRHDYMWPNASMRSAAANCVCSKIVSINHHHWFQFLFILLPISK